MSQFYIETEYTSSNASGTGSKDSDQGRQMGQKYPENI